MNVAHASRGQEGQQQDAQPGIEESAINADPGEERHQQHASSQLHAATAAASRRHEAVELVAEDEQQHGEGHQPRHHQREQLVAHHQQQFGTHIAENRRHDAVKDQSVLVLGHGMPIAEGTADIAGQGSIGVGRIGEHRRHAYEQQRRKHDERAPTGQ